MTKLQKALVTVLLLLCAVPAFGAPIGFETGNLAGWTSAGAVSVVEGEVLLPLGFPSYTVIPTEGQYQALLISTGVSAGYPTGVPAAYLEGFFNTPVGFLTADPLYVQGSGLKRDVHLAAGDTLSFDWRFITNDSPPFNDAAWLFITNEAGTLLSSVDVIYAAEGISEYQQYSFVAPTPGMYMIGLGVFDHTDPAPEFESYLAVDNFNTTPAPDITPVPEPGSLMLLGSGLAGLIGLGKKRRQRS